MSFRLFWFVVAGFVLGFTTSTLWEWLYYRRKRLQLLETHGETLLDSRRSYAAEPAEQSSTGAFDIDEWTLPAYRSSGVLLESEEQTITPDFAGVSPAGKMPVRPVRADEDRLTASMLDTSVEGQMGLGIATEAKRDAPEVSALVEPATTEASTTVHYSSITTSDHEHAPQDPAFQATDREAETLADELVQDEQQSAGNAQAIARAGALAAATLASTRPMGTRLMESTVAIPTEAASPGPMLADQEVEERELTAAPTARETIPAGSAESVPRTPNHSPLHRPTDYPDDLAMIKGIGEAYKRRLYATGIYTWRQLAESSTDALRRITRAKPNADIESWQTQARTLAEKYQRMQANFSGPLDDFTRIEGIGAITADIFYKAGICTYEQLAASKPDELALIVPAPTVGNENDFDGWINDAARLAGAKRRNNGLLA